jgi:hypothetical protein
VSLPTEPSLAQRDQSDPADERPEMLSSTPARRTGNRSGIAQELAAGWRPLSEQAEHPQDDDDHHDRADDGQNEVHWPPFLSLDNDRSGPRSGARSLRTGARPLDAGKQQAHHRRADIPRVLWTQVQYSTWPCACHEHFFMRALYAHRFIRCLLRHLIARRDSVRDLHAVQAIFVLVQRHDKHVAVCPVPRVDPSSEGTRGNL